MAEKRWKEMKKSDVGAEKHGGKKMERDEKIERGSGNDAKRWKIGRGSGKKRRKWQKAMEYWMRERNLGAKLQKEMENHTWERKRGGSMAEAGLAKPSHIFSVGFSSHSSFGCGEFVGSGVAGRRWKARVRRCRTRGVGGGWGSWERESVAHGPEQREGRCPANVQRATPDM